MLAVDAAVVAMVVAVLPRSMIDWQIEDELLNAVVCRRPAEALADARARDAVLQKQRILREEDNEDEEEEEEEEHHATLSPFFGVPTVVKECMEFVGLPYTSGVFGRKGVLGQRHATVVQRLEGLGGFVVMGSTNLSEGCMWFEVGGTTRRQAVPY